MTPSPSGPVGPPATSTELHGRTALVTSPAGGVGRATVALLLRRGARVVASDRRENVRQLEHANSTRVAAIVGRGR